MNRPNVSDLVGRVSSALASAFPAFGLLSSSSAPQFGLPLPRRRRRNSHGRLDQLTGSADQLTGSADQLTGPIRLEHPSDAALSLDATPAAARGLARALSSFEQIRYVGAD